jgi:hypothetical protein
MYNENASPTLRNLTFSGNLAQNYGGGVFNVFSSPTLTNVIFTGNRANINGGGLYNWTGCSPELTNVIFYDNTALGDGGGMANGGAAGDVLNLINVTFANNSAGNGGAIHNVNSTLNLTNAILWGNQSDQIYHVSGGVTVTYSDIQGGYPGTANIDADPQFVDAPNGDLRLQGDSPAIDSGDNGACPAADMRGENRDDWGCDMGVYETQLSDADTISKAVVSGNTYTFGPTFARVEVVNANCLTALSIQRVDANHPNATAGIETGRYWAITPTGCDSGFDLTLTLPTSFASDGSDKLCRYTGAGWDCGAAGEHSAITDGPTGMPNGVVRQGVTELSDWAVGDDVGPTAVTLHHLTASHIDPPWMPVLIAFSLLLGMGIWQIMRRRG